MVWISQLSEPSSPLARPIDTVEPQRILVLLRWVERECLGQYRVLLTGRGWTVLAGMPAHILPRGRLRIYDLNLPGVVGHLFLTFISLRCRYQYNIFCYPVECEWRHPLQQRVSNSTSTTASTPTGGTDSLLFTTTTCLFLHLSVSRPRPEFRDWASSP